MREFIVLMASLTALIALSIDAMLPALGPIGADLHVIRQNSVQLVITVLFAGMMIGYLIYGQMADAWGRKPSLTFGIVLYIIGSLISWQAWSLTVLLIGRFVQGLGVAGPRIVTLAIIRDKYKGREMAKIMSLVMGVFIFVPIVAPLLGQVIMAVSHWRTIFLFYIAAAIGGQSWAHFRLEETLAPEMKRPFSIEKLISGFKEAATTRVTLGYSITSGVVFGALISYLNSIQQILQEIYHTGDLFALYFGMLAAAIGASFFLNSTLVQRFGMRKLTARALISITAISLLFLPLALSLTPVPLPLFLLYGACCFFCLGLTFGNMGAMAMEPMGHIAGTASAFVSFLSTAVAIVLGGIIGQLYNGTIIPLCAGYLVLSAIAYGVMVWTEKEIPS
ncbi:MAG: multidrug effflux MFS transporter [Alphaproteobacteria bacterium]|nr:multidrug effflux MFS transporter [Alphaproteobacteria bacterium]